MQPQTAIANESNTTDIAKQKKTFIYRKSDEETADDDKPLEFAVNIGGIFFSAGFLAGLIIIYFAPKDSMNNFQFYSPFPYLYHHRRKHLLPKDEITINNDPRVIRNLDENDFAHSMVFCFAVATLYSVVGRYWWISWTSPLRKKILKPVHLVDVLGRMSKYSIRNAIHGILSSVLIAKY